MSSFRSTSTITVAVVSKEENFDSLLSSIGFGFWQVTVLSLAFFCTAASPIQFLGATFLNAPVKFRCSTGEMDTCERFDEGCRNNSVFVAANETYYNSKCLPLRTFNQSIYRIIDNLSLREHQHLTYMDSCPIIEYDTSIYQLTIVSHFDLVCERNHLRPWFVTLGAIGNLFGSILGGYLGDKWGRLFTVRVGSIANIFLTVAMAFSPNYPLLFLTRFFSGCSISGTLVAAWSLGVETTPSKYRAMVFMLMGLPFSSFIMAMAGLAYLFRTWMYILLAGSTPAFLLLLCSFIATESPRWLLQQGRLEEATKVLEKAKAMNRAKLECSISSTVSRLAMDLQPETLVKGENHSCTMSVVETFRTVISYLRSPAMRTIILCMGGIWFLHNILYMGVVLNANNFSVDDPFLYVALMGVMDASAILLLTPLTGCFGRRVFLLAGYIVGGVLFFLELIVPESYDWIRWAMVMAAFFLISGSLQVNFLYAPEVFPTEIRARGFAYSQVLGSVGSSVAPFITDVLSQYNWWVTGVSFGTAGIMAGVLVPFLPETRNKVLPETIQDLEDRCKKAIDIKDKEAQMTSKQLQGVENKSYTQDVDCHL